ncbi:class A sortase [Sporolactobacillus shoreae]|uniref:Class A sortase n=1 Tax=Sporolactobacillus shoreae TaxID=1465501 RepID=A0A4Z0GPS1_9BACL|nr:class A sortase [Sporolactobacillus shoreae]TGA98026.1 class A sortase [Sporolactobacillus shoreae]
MWKKSLIIALILSGLTLIASPFLKEYIVGFLSSRYNSWKITANQIDQNNRRKAFFDFNAIEPPNFYDTLKAGTQLDPKALVGRISIKSIGINLPILKGTTNVNLLVGATTMRPDQQMGKGNYPLAGHHMREANLLFGPLMHIKIGDLIVLTDLKKDYAYRVTGEKIVSAALGGGLIAQTKDARITLVTCDKPTRTPNRLIVTGKLVSIDNYSGK